VTKKSFNLEPKAIEGIEKRVRYNSDMTQVVNSALTHWFAIMDQAKRKLEPRFSRAEKGLILDATNGSWLGDMMNATLIWANVEDAISMDGLDTKWEVKDAQALIDKLKGLTPPECWALAEAIKEWWGDDYTNDKDFDELLKSNDDKPELTP